MMAHDLGFDRFTYRAKGVYDKQWIEGNIVVTPKIEYIMIDFDGESQNIVEETICRPTAFQAYHTVENGNIQLEQLIFEKDIIRIEFQTKTTADYLIWYNNEMNMFDAIPLCAARSNGNDYYCADASIKITWSDFCFLMQDPEGIISSVSVIGNTLDTPQLLSYS